MSDIRQEKTFKNQPIPVSLEGTKKIVSQLENCICKIYKKNGETGTGFFCNIPFNNNLLPVLITNNHVLNKNDIDKNKIIKFMINNKVKKIEMDDSRKKYTNPDKTIDITIIEIRPNKDGINNYLEIDKNDLDKDKENLELEYLKKSAYILHYPNEELQVSYGLINDLFGNKTINHFCNTEDGSSGSPILSLKTFQVIGVHYGSSQNQNININFGIFIKYVIDEFNNFYNNKSNNKENKKENNNSDNNKSINKENIKEINNSGNNKSKNKEYKNEINLIYKVDKEGEENIFGDQFVYNNKNNIELLINGSKKGLIKRYKLKKGENNIKIIIKNKITNLECMFYDCKSLKNIKELEYLDTKNINNFSFMLSGCSNLLNLKGLENWDVSNGNNFSFMFSGCSSLINLKELENWNVSNGNNFRCMLSGCSSLTDIRGLEKWNVSNGINFSEMFSSCSSLSDIKSLHNWNVSKGNNFSSMFYECSSLSDLKGLENWNVSNGNEYNYMFSCCSLLSDIKILKSWDLSNGKSFSYMFSGCSLLSDIKSLQIWKLSDWVYEDMI